MEIFLITFSKINKKCHEEKSCFIFVIPLKILHRETKKTKIKKDEREKKRNNQDKQTFVHEQIHVLIL